MGPRNSKTNHSIMFIHYYPGYAAAHIYTLWPSQAAYDLMLSGNTIMTTR